MPASLISGPRTTYDAKVGAGLSRGPKKSKLLNAASWAGTWPAPQATLDIDFVNDKSYIRGAGQGNATQFLSYTRASTATYIGQDGLLKIAYYGAPPSAYQRTLGTSGTNILFYSEDFGNAAWTKTGLTVADSTSTQTPPVGSSSYRMTESSGAITISALSEDSRWNLGSGVNNTLSVYAKEDPASAKRYLVLGLQRSPANGTDRWAYAIFDIATGGVITRVDGSQNNATGAGVQDVGNGWKRVYINFNSPLAGQRVMIGLTDVLGGYTNTYTLGGYTGDGSSGLFIASAQNEPSGTITSQWRQDWSSTSTVAQVNMLTYTDQFDSTASGNNLNGLTFSPNSEIAPDGTLTADGMIETSTNTGHYVTRQATTASNTQYIASCYFKPSNRIYSAINIVQNTFNYTTVTFTLSGDGSYSIRGTVGFTNVSPTIVALPNGWYRCSVAFTTNTNTGGSNFVRFFTSDSSTPSSLGSDGNFSYLGNGLLAVYAWGAQLELGSTATTYRSVSYPTTNIPLASTTTPNGILIEETRTNQLVWCRDATQPGQNYITYSEQFDQSVWSATSNGLTVSADVAATTDPLGTNTADKLVETSTTGVHCVIQGFTGSATIPYTASIYLKAAERTLAEVWVINTGQTIGSGIRVDLSTGQFVSSRSVGGSTLQNYTITSAGNGWWRVSVTALTGNTSIALLAGSVLTGTPTSTFSYTGVAGNGIYAWGAQLEGANRPTGYQVTTTASITQGWNKTNCTIVKDQTGIGGAANAACRLTATAPYATCIQSWPQASGSRTCSVYLKSIGVLTGDVQVSLDGGASWSTVDLSNGQWNRVVLSGSLTNPSVGVRITSSGDAVAMDFAQVETGAFPSSPIMTASTAATRSTDAVSVLLDRYDVYPQAFQGTFIGETRAVTVGSTGQIFDTTNRYWAGASTNDFRGPPSWIVRSNILISGNKKFAAAYKPGTNAYVVNGALFTGGGEATIPFGSQLVLGASASFASGLNGCISRFIIVPIRLSNEVLTEITR